MTLVGGPRRGVKQERLLCLDRIAGRLARENFDLAGSNTDAEA